MTSLNSRNEAVPIVVALLCILSIGMGAATLDSAQQFGPGGDGPIPMDSESQEPAQQQEPSDATFGGAESESTTGSFTTYSRCIPFLASTAGTGLVLLGFGALVGLIYMRYNFSTALLAGWTAFPLVMLVYFLLTNCATSDASGVGGGSSNMPNPGEALAPMSNVPPWMLGGFIGVVLLGAVVAMFRFAGEDEVVVVEEEEMDEEPELDRFAEAAGRAADRIEEHNADVDNAVYRAWIEMTDLLDVDDPETYSAGEFADAAIELGMAKPDVNELTRLFNEVRYGGREAETREEQALSVLRSIEEQYGTPADEDVDTPNMNADETQQEDEDEEEDEER